jgi:hypothetical protein
MFARWMVCVLATLLAVAGAGCGSSRFHGDEGKEEKTGTLSAALQTTGSDGATYRFVAGTQLLINAIGPGSAGRAFTVDGTETLFQKPLGPGNYQLGLAFGGFPTPHLLRITAAGTTTVEATWTDEPQPLPFTIVATQKTEITLHFTVPGLGNVTFSPGNLAVDIAVNNETRTKPSSVIVGATMMGTSIQFSNGYAADNTLTAVANGTPLHLTLIVSPKPTSQWILDLDAACIDVLVADTSAGAGETGFATRLEQVEGGEGRICITDEGTSDSFWLGVWKDGAMPASQQATYPGTYTRYVNVYGTVDDVFDGTTLNQSLLGAGLSLSGTFDNTVYDFASGAQLTRLEGLLSAGSVTAQP